MHDAFYHLYSTSDSPLDPDKAEFRRARRTWLCPGCSVPRPEVRHVEMRIHGGMPQGEALNFVNGCGVSVARRDFLDSFGEDLVEHDLFLGRMFTIDGVELADLATFRGRCRLIIRGRHTASYRYCRDCGRLVYFSEHRERYLWPAPPLGFSLFDTGWGGLLVTEDLFRTLDQQKWKNLGVEELPVVGSPRDGLGTLEGAIAICPIEP